jgi:hypothetical protein
VDEPSKAPKVFLSYSHDSDTHAQRVLALANKLREEGIDAELDQYVAHPNEGWPQWARRQLEESSFVLLICTPTYRRRFERKETAGMGKRVIWEALLAEQLLYEAGGINEKLVPVFFEDGTDEDIPLVLRGFARYSLPEGYEELYRCLTTQPKVIRPELGPMRTMRSTWEQPHREDTAFLVTDRIREIEHHRALRPRKFIKTLYIAILMCAATISVAYLRPDEKEVSDPTPTEEPRCTIETDRDDITKIIIYDTDTDVEIVQLDGGSRQVFRCVSKPTPALLEVYFADGRVLRQEHELFPNGGTTSLTLRPDESTYPPPDSTYSKDVDAPKNTDPPKDVAPPVKRLSVQPSVPAHTTKRCAQVRKATNTALSERRWPRAVELARQKVCWASKEQPTRRRMQVMALLELGRFEECVKAGVKAIDAETVNMVSTCRKILEER